MAIIKSSPRPPRLLSVGRNRPLLVLLARNVYGHRGRWRANRVGIDRRCGEQPYSHPPVSRSSSSSSAVHRPLGGTCRRRAAFTRSPSRSSATAKREPTRQMRTEGSVLRASEARRWPRDRAVSAARPLLACGRAALWESLLRGGRNRKESGRMELSAQWEERNPYCLFCSRRDDRLILRGCVFSCCSVEI